MLNFLYWFFFKKFLECENSSKILKFNIEAPYMHHDEVESVKAIIEKH